MSTLNNAPHGATTPEIRTTPDLARLLLQRLAKQYRNLEYLYRHRTDDPHGIFTHLMCAHADSARIIEELLEDMPAATPDSVFSPLPAATGPYVDSPVKTPVNKLDVTPAAPGEVYAIASTTIGASLPPASDVIRFMTGNAGTEVLRLDASGMTYMGTRIEDAGEAHRAFIATMHAMQQAPACQKNDAVLLTEKDAVAQEKGGLAARLLRTLEAMANTPAYVGMELWNDHSNAVLEAARQLNATPQSAPSEAQARVTELEAKLDELRKEVAAFKANNRYMRGHSAGYEEAKQYFKEAAEQAVAKERAEIAAMLPQLGGFNDFNDIADIVDDAGCNVRISDALRLLHARLANPASAEKGAL